MKPQKFYSNGKLLITGEYLVLDGALALAIPTKHGQWLSIEPSETSFLKWESFDNNGELWFESNLSIGDISELSSTANNPVAHRLVQILNATKKQNPTFLYGEIGLKITTRLDFPRNWGLGTSSTLINNMAQWAHIDPYKLLEDTFGGSGYDIACAIHNVPLTYQLEENGRTIIERDFNPEFKKHLYFVFLNKKQNSRDGIATYQKNKNNTNQALTEINAITNDMIHCTNLETFQFLMQSHETIISKITKQQPIQDMIFNDFKGVIKSLGAWGGDFVLAASDDHPEAYFKGKGFDTIIPYADMIL